MHILFISDNYYPESNALANRLYDHARTWVSCGHKVTILTCAPNFPKGQVFTGYHNKWRYVEEIEGVRIIRIKSYIAENKGTLKRTLDYISFALHASIQGLFVKKPDIVMATSPQPFPIFSAWLVAKLKRKPFIFELRDLWPESVVAVDAMGKNNIMLRFFGWAIRRMYRAADVIVAVTERFKDILIEQEKINPQKIIISKNGVNIKQLVPAVLQQHIREKYQWGDKFIVAYIGTIGMAHHIQTLLEAASTNTDPDVHFVVMGSGADATAIEQSARHLSNATYIPGGNRQAALDILWAVDASIVHLRDTPLFKAVIPSKIFEAMALGKPILMGVKGESRTIVLEQAKAGVAFEPENAADLNLAIARLKNSGYDGAFAKQFVEAHYNRDKIAMKMLTQMTTYLAGRDK